MFALDVIWNIIQSSKIKKLFEDRSVCFFLENPTLKLWINTFNKVSQEKIAQDLADSGLIESNQITMSEHYDSVVIAIPVVEDIEEIHKLITDQLNNGNGITDTDFSIKLLFKGFLVNFYRIDYQDSDPVLKISVSFLFDLEKSVELCFGIKKHKTMYDVSNQGYLTINGEQSNILFNLTYRNIVHNHYKQYGVAPTEFIKWAISPDKHLAVAATKHLLFIWNDECVNDSSVIVIPVTYYEAHLQYYPECIQISNSEQFIVKSNGIHYTYNKKGELIATSA